MADQKNDVTKNTGAQSGQGAASAAGSSEQGQGSLTPAGGQEGSVTGAATAAAKSLYDQAKETAGQAYGVVTDKAASTLDEKKATLSDGLTTVADSLRKAGDNLGQGPAAENPLAGAARQYGSTAAEKIQGLARYFEQKDVRTMARDLENYARRNPAVFIGAAFGLGLLAARFLKSAQPPNYYGGSERQSATPGGSFDAGRGNFDLREEESGQGLQMADQSFEPTGGKAAKPRSGAGMTGQNLGGATAGGTLSGATPPTGTASKKKAGGASTKNTDSTRDSLGNPM